MTIIRNQDTSLDIGTFTDYEARNWLDRNFQRYVYMDTTYEGGNEVWWVVRQNINNICPISW